MVIEQREAGQQLVVIDRLGVFRLSEAAEARLEELGVPREHQDFFRSGEYRADPRLVQTVLELKAAASAEDSRIIVVALPAGIEWEVHDWECDAGEYVEEVRRTWDRDAAVTAIPEDWVRPEPIDFAALVAAREAERTTLADDEEGEVIEAEYRSDDEPPAEKTEDTAWP